jgi:hypothetical protein
MLIHCWRRKVSLRFAILLVFIHNVILLICNWWTAHLQIQLGLSVRINSYTADSGVIRRYIFMQVRLIIRAYLLLSPSALNRFDRSSSRISVHTSSSWRRILIGATYLIGELVLKQLVCYACLVEDCLTTMWVLPWVTYSRKFLWCLSHFFAVVYMV